jgi:hypothetical protein
MPLTYADVFPINLHAVISIDPPTLLMAPPARPPCQKQNNETIETAVLEIVRNEASEK